ncbi:2Fe-2S iron-sulfur cluster-binding protein [Streptomyces sp. NPDC005805]|uniref:2Fe-2S iron-sulfur cluster-binding protein n=1 Tax=Streptomyces sp. NPDC005805 TaxID=3157068 RepID=UPI0033D1C093
MSNEDHRHGPRTGDRPDGDRAERAERGEYAERARPGEYPGHGAYGDRAEYGDRTEFDDRAEGADYSEGGDGLRLPEGFVRDSAGQGHGYPAQDGFGTHGYAGSGPAGEGYGPEYGQPYGQGHHPGAPGAYGTGGQDTQGAGQSFAPDYDGWQPTAPGSDYDGESTAFVQLPPEGLPDGAPLEAPGHGYTPPMILPLKPLSPAADTDPGAPGGWGRGLGTGAPGGGADAGAGASGGRPEAVRWPEPGETRPDPAADPHATGQWTFPQETPPTAAHEMTGQWSIPIAEGDLPEESGEFARTDRARTDPAPGDPSATLPGGAPAPWATLPGGAAAPWADQLPAQPADPAGDAAETADGLAGSAHADPDTAPAAEASEPVAPSPAPEPPAEDPGPATGAAAAGGAAEPSEPPSAPDRSDSAPGDPTAVGPAAADAPGPSAPASADPETRPDLAPAAGPEPAHDPGPEPDAPGDEHPATSYVLRVNGTDRPVSDAWIGESLLYVLRERLGLAGAKDGCSQGECGACNVQVDGRLVASCLVPAATAAGSEVRTVEGLADGGEPSDVQRALAACGAVQCGFCIPGMAMTVHDLLEGNHAPTELETRQALCGNLCRCSGYQGVLAAVREVVAERAAGTADAADDSPAEPSADPQARIPHQAPPGAGGVQAHPHDAHPHDGGMA